MHILSPIAAAKRVLRAMHRAGTGRRARAPMLFVVLAAAASPAGAEICKYADTDGNVHYSNVAPEKGWKRLGCTLGDDGTVRRAGPANGGTARSTSSPAGFPRVDTETQRGRDDVRRKVLTEELATEEKLLVEARRDYADGAPAPLPEEKADADKYRTRIGKLRQTVNVHEQNVLALKKEIGTIK